MASVSAMLFDELGYDPDDGVPDLGELASARTAGHRAGDLAIDRLIDSLAAGSIAPARIGVRRVAVARLGSGKLVVVDDACPHDGGRISDGYVDGERIVCARHGWELEARNGRCERACKLRE